MPPTTVAAYLAALPAERKTQLSKLRTLILKHLPRGYEEGIEFGMPSYHVPLATFPDTYNGRPLQLAAFAANKGGLSLYLCALYADPAARAWFDDACRKAGIKLDMGKSCIRAKTVDALPLSLIGQAIARVSVADYLALYAAAKASKRPASKRPASKRPTTKRPASKRPATKRPTTKRPTAAKSRK